MHTFHILPVLSPLFYCRSRRKVRLEQKRIRIRPCLSVCQTVEQKCPYLLPADRAPAYPTQYAGEPTFLCLGECVFAFIWDLSTSAWQSLRSISSVSLISPSLYCRSQHRRNGQPTVQVKQRPIRMLLRALRQWWWIVQQFMRDDLHQQPYCHHTKQFNNSHSVKSQSNAKSLRHARWRLLRSQWLQQYARRKRHDMPRPPEYHAVNTAMFNITSASCLKRHVSPLFAVVIHCAIDISLNNLPTHLSTPNFTARLHCHNAAKEPLDDPFMEFNIG